MSDEKLEILRLGGEAANGILLSQFGHDVRNDIKLSILL